MIAVRQPTKRFGTADFPVAVRREIDFSVDEGELVVFVGSSGRGTSTLLRILAGLLPQSAGAALLHGTPITGLRRDFPLKYGVLKQAVSGSDLVTDDLIADVNDFDATAVQQRALRYGK